jgi:type 1 fimbria pilin
MVLLWTAGTVYGNTLVSVSGTIRASPDCLLNNNQDINIDFGDRVDSGNIDGENYKTRVIFSLSCRNLGRETVQIMIQGVRFNGDPTAIRTSYADLGLRFKLDGSNSIRINEYFAVDYLKLPVLEVVPIKTAGAELRNGDFSANALFILFYV